MLQFSSLLSSHIRFLLQSLTDSNFVSVLRDLCQTLEYGIEGSILLLQTILYHMNLLGEDMQRKQYMSGLFSEVFSYLLDQPNFGTVCCEAFRNVIISKKFLQEFSNELQLSVSEKVALGLALADSENDEFRTIGQDFNIGLIQELCRNPASVDSVEEIQNIILFFYQSEGLTKYVDSFMQMLALMEPKERTSLILAPLLKDDVKEARFLRNLDMFHNFNENEFDSLLVEMESETSVSDIMREVGYRCTVNSTHCKEVLSNFLPLNEVTLSRILSTVAQSYSGLEDSQLSHSLFCSAIGSSAAFDISCPGSWNVDILVDSVNQLAPGIHWKIVMEYLDHEGFYIPNSQAFSFFMSIYARACQDPFPLHAVCNSVWKNVDGQLSFLRYAVSAPVEIFTFEHSVRKLAYVEACNRHELLSIQGNHAWLSLDLIDVLCQLAERGYANSVRAMLDYPLKHCPELLLLGISQICTAYNLLQHDVSSAIFPMVVENSVGSLILYLWHSNSKFVAHGLVHMIKADQSSIIRMLGICYEQKILSSFLEQIPFSCSIRLAVLASQEEYLCLEKWLNDNLNDYKDIFAEECLKFFKEISLDAAEDMSHDLFQSPGVVENIYFKTSSTFIKVFRANTEHITSDHIAEELERMNRASMHVKPRLQNVGTSDSSNLYGYADDIEAEADSYLSQIFYSQMPINVMIHMLSKLKESSEKREQLIFDHVIQNLLDEYRFFPRYPEKQLKIVAILFGSLIKHRLVNNLNLGIALRSVLDALRKPTDSKLFVFGTKALEQFVDRLVELPQYCSLILQISHLRGMHPELVDFAESALAWISSSCLEKDEDNTYVIYPQDDSTAAASKNLKLPGVMTRQPSHQLSPSQQMEQRLEEVIGDRIKASMTSSICMKPLLPQSAHPSNGFLNDVASSQKTVLSQNTIMAVPSTAPDFPHSRGVTSTRFGSALNIGTLVAAAEKRNTLVETPASDVQDKIFFLINNISSSNVDAKVKEFTEILNEEHYSWFAQYMVMKRASIEPNFHDLYLTFLKKVNSKRLNEEIVKDAYENCKVILRSELIKSSSEERSLLKNLGSWLGKFTIGRNQVLRAREIDPKSLIIEAYERGLMIAVIPFTSKILEPCQYSLAYKPPNPWTMAILGLLAEIYALPNLKMNLKFDIEVLFKNLGVDMKKVNPTSLLKNCLRKIEGNPDFSNRDVGASQPPVVTQINSGIKSILNKVDLEPEIINTSHSDGQLKLVSGISKIETQFIFNNKLSSLGLHHLKRVVSIIVERAIKKLLSPVVQRCVPIAIQTTKELVLKDYATESDETLIYDAAHSMVASLAGSLAHVTCKETLHTSLSCQLRNSFQGLNVPNEHLEQAVALVINDNLDFGCAVIQHAASVKAVQSIDCEITRQLSLRRKNREGIDRSYYDANINAQGPKTVISESQLPRPGQSSHSQQQVYEDFVHFSWRNQVGQNSNVVPASLPASSGASVSSTLSCPQFPSAGQLNHGPYLSGNEPAGLDGVNYPLDLISVEIDSNQFLSSSSTSIGATDDINLLAANQSSVSSLCPIAAAPEVHSEEVPYARKELRPTAESLPTAPIDQLGSGISEPLLSMSDVLEKYQIISQKLDMLVSKESGEAEIHIPKIILKCVSQDEAALAIAQKVFKSLYENASNSSHVGSHISIIAAIRDVCKLVVKEVTSWVIYSDEDRKFNTNITFGLMRKGLLNLAEYNKHMAKLIDSGKNKTATEFAISLLETLLVQESSLTLSELPNLIDSLAKLAARPGAPESLQKLVEIAKNPPENAASPSGNIVGKNARDKKSSDHSVTIMDGNVNAESTGVDLAGFYDQVSVLFSEWYHTYIHHGANDAPCAYFVSKLQQSGFLNGDDTSDKFFRFLMEHSVAHCLSSERIGSSLTFQSPQTAQDLSFLLVDVYAKLVVVILKQYLATDHLLSKIFQLTVRVIQRKAEEKKASFNPRPYFRLFVNWLLDLVSPHAVLDGAKFQVLIAFADTFHALQPLKVPAFSFAWLELISHKSFMPKLLTVNAPSGWVCAQLLLVDLLKFMEPYLRNAKLEVPIRLLYKGTLRLLLVLMHDFPEFLCNYHFSFCDVIPSSCIQMRNIILSAHPSNMQLPDPSTPNLKIDLLPDVHIAPHVFSEVDAALGAKQMKYDVDEYLKTTRQAFPFLSELKKKLLLPQNEAAAQAGTRYNVPLINSLILYVGMQTIQQLPKKNTPALAQQMTCNGPMESYIMGPLLALFQTLIVELDAEGCYLVLNAIANQLRHPSSHTHLYSYAMLYLFNEAKQETIKEQITRVLVERLMVNKPHPWGVKITFLELIKNPQYNFWSHAFIKCSPEIEKMVKTISI
ncbi:CCR4-NOT transcription complex subunit 1-like isoform X4 [Durio zibethinus]|uniref:CCR4-NOT transcription complex subunit 1-like isoform X4 n=1 Tax=Durio zibethinus TaxID=66656 RepID=A0A6P5XT33_DURZI|nr:CCR4-NOT transcription complex subunit 1-like isoform X4 [Durio zibethinus]